MQQTQYGCMSASRLRAIPAIGPTALRLCGRPQLAVQRNAIMRPRPVNIAVIDLTTLLRPREAKP